MKRSLYIIMILMLVLGAAACASPASESSAPTIVPTQQPMVEQTQQPTIEPIQQLTPEEAAIASASTADELRELVEQFKNEKSYEALYLAAIKLVGIDPPYAPGYTDAASALLEMSKSNYEEINSLLARGCQNTKNNAGYIAEWVVQNEPNLKMALPFIPDYTSSDQINTVGITSGNSSNKMKTNGVWQGGLLTTQGEWVYFSSANENFALYKMRINGENIEKLGEVSGSFLNVVGDWLYFCNQNDNNVLYKMRTDGSEKTKITDDGCEFISVSDGWIYYCNISDEGCLYKIGTDGSKRMKLTDCFVMAPYISGEWVYYYAKQEGGFWRIRTDGSGKQLLTGQQVGPYCISSEWIYYLTDKNGMVIEKMRLDGSEQTEVYQCDGKVSAMNMAGNRMIVSGDRILIINMDTLNAEREIDTWSEAVCTAGDGWLYYADGNDGNIWYRIIMDNGETEKLR